MRRFYMFQFLAALAAASPAAAQNQYGGGHSGITTEYTYTGSGAWKDLNSFGACFAKRQTKDALKLVQTDAGSADEARVYKALFSKEQYCLGERLPAQDSRECKSLRFITAEAPIGCKMAG